MQTKWSMDVHRHYAKQHETLQLPWIRRHFAALSGAYALYFAFCVAAAYTSRLETKVRAPAKRRFFSVHGKASVSCCILLLFLTCYIVYLFTGPGGLWELPRSVVPIGFMYSLVGASVYPAAKALQRLLLYNYLFSQDLMKAKGSFRKTRGKVDTAVHAARSSYIGKQAMLLRRKYKSLFGINGDLFYIRVAAMEIFELVVQGQSLVSSLDTFDQKDIIVYAVILALNSITASVLLCLKKRTALVIADALFDVAYLFINSNRFLQSGRASESISFADQLSLFIPLFSIGHMLSEYSAGLLLSRSGSDLEIGGEKIYQKEKESEGKAEEDKEEGVRKVTMVLSLPDALNPRIGIKRTRIAAIVLCVAAAVASTMSIFIIKSTLYASKLCKDKYGVVCGMQCVPEFTSRETRPCDRPSVI